jgi:hypothetical protein
MAAIAIALVSLGHEPIATVALLAAWGLIGTPAPVGWGTWLSKALPEDAEAGGGLMVATIQLAITAGASVGGLLFDAQRLPKHLRRQCGPAIRIRPAGAPGLAHWIGKRQACRKRGPMPLLVSSTV